MSFVVKQKKKTVIAPSSLNDCQCSDRQNKTHIGFRFMAPHEGITRIKKGVCNSIDGRRSENL